jgi:hypothetical protein
MNVVQFATTELSSSNDDFSRGRRSRHSQERNLSEKALTKSFSQQVRNYRLQVNKICHSKF